MGIKDIHTVLHKPMHMQCAPKDMRGKHVAMDVSSFRTRAFRGDAPTHFRPTAVCKYGFRAVLARLFSTWTHALGEPALLAPTTKPTRAEWPTRSRRMRSAQPRVTRQLISSIKSSRWSPFRTSLTTGSSHTATSTVSQCKSGSTLELEVASFGAGCVHCE